MVRFVLSLSVLLIAPLTGRAQIVYQPSPAARVTLASGTLQGALPAPGVRAFLGIPYARQPVGPLRWQPPQPFGQWTGTRMAVAHGNPCPQQRFGWNNGAAAKGKEDCLYLNVWAPTQGEHLPVMVYIHGGSNVAGTASEDLSNGLTLVPRGVVLVTLDYRLGIFGFFRTPALDRESPHQASGDYGLLDQIAALQWIEGNIARFGGDPGKVMIFGQSAGSVDVGLLMASPQARGLFREALEESGQVLGLMPTATREQAERAWAPVARQIGPNLEAMRAASTAAVLAADKNAPKPPPEHGWGYRGASVDGWVLPEEPYKTFAAGMEAPVPLLIGSNVEEIVPKEPIEAADRSMTAALGAKNAAKLEALYAKPGADPLLGGVVARWATDHDFRCAVRQVAAWHSAHGYPTFVYQFDHPLPGNKTALHSSELFFLFDYFPGEKSATREQSALSNVLQSYWTEYVKTGAPGAPAGLPQWPAYGGAHAGPYLHFPAVGASPTGETDLGGGACAIISPQLAAHD